jgi:hypothetical protein
MENLAKVLLEQLAEEQIKQLLSGCIITQSGVQGIVEDGMLKTKNGKMDIRPAQIVAIKLAVQPDEIKNELVEVKKERTKLKREITQLKKSMGLLEEALASAVNKKKKK